MLGGIAAVLVLLGICAFLFFKSARFGRLPQGERLARIEQSPHYRDGSFHNLTPDEHKPDTAERRQSGSRIWGLIKFAFRQIEGAKPIDELPVVKTDLKSLDRNTNLFVWFGHSSYMVQADGKRFVVDPVFGSAAPVSFFKTPFKGTKVYKAADLPDIDYLIITHDHWDHMEYQTIMEIKDRVKKVVCGLGIGEHLERWGFPASQVVELDWHESATLENGVQIHCLPARHYSGRSLERNKALWASFLIQTANQKIYAGGDSGYDTFFKDIGDRFNGVDLAFIENGQYNIAWQHIHIMPDKLAQTARDLRAKKVLTTHNSRFALGKHHWKEPYANSLQLREKDSIDCIIPMMGQVVHYTDSVSVVNKWWEGLE